MKFKSNKKGQLKILESVAVLIVFFFLVGMGISFYSKIQIQSLEAAKAEFISLDATKVSQKIIHLPELRCSLKNTDQGSCIDLYQAKAWAALSNDVGCRNVNGGLGNVDLCAERVNHYFEIIGVGEVVLTRIYSANSVRRSDPNVDIILYNYTLEYPEGEEHGSKFTQIPVIIRDSVTQTNDFGLLKVRVYE
jgi:hypothetical protein